MHLGGPLACDEKSLLEYINGCISRGRRSSFAALGLGSKIYPSSADSIRSVILVNICPTDDLWSRARSTLHQGGTGTRYCTFVDCYDNSRLTKAYRMPSCSGSSKRDVHACLPSLQTSLVVVTIVTIRDRMYM